MRRYAGALIVLAVFVVLLLVVLLTQQNNNTPTSTPVAAVPTISQADKDLQILSIPVTDTVSQLDVKTITGTVSLKLDAGAWKQTAPSALVLDSSVVSSTVEQLEVLKGSTYISADKATDLKSFGLDNPSTVVTITAGSGVKTLQFGALNQASKNYYVKLAGDGRVWTVASTVVDAVTTLQTAPPTPAPTIGTTDAPLTPLPTLTPTTTAGTPTVASGSPAAPTTASTPAPTTAATSTTAAATTAAATTVGGTTAAVTTTAAATTAGVTTAAATTSAVTTAAVTTAAPSTTK